MVDRNPSIFKTPPRSLQKRHSSSALSGASPFLTPSRIPSRNFRSSHKKPRMTPSPIVLRYPSSGCQTPLKSGGGGGGDRFIPTRRGMNMEFVRRNLLSEEKRTKGRNEDDEDAVEEKAKQSPAETPIQKEYKRRMMSSLCNIPLDVLDEDAMPRGLLSFNHSGSGVMNAMMDENNVPNGRSPWRTNRIRVEDPYQHDSLRVLQQFESLDDSFATAVRHSDIITRKIPSQPCRILDAPDLVDDYYLNLISWSDDNILAVALAHCVYLWNAGTGEIQHLATIEGEEDYVTSVAWCTVTGQSKYLAIGTNSNVVQLWDTHASKLVRTLRGHTGRVASIAWNQHWLSSGGRDSLIIQNDVRSANPIVARYRAHEQEVCGLKWNEDGTALASGGNENYLCIWDAKMSSRQRDSPFTSYVAPRLLLKQHKAAVKALDWCPFNRGLLASGGGTADRTIKLWNSNSGAMLKSIDTGSQVCSVLWSKHQRELCSSHGFSENQLILWKYGNRSSLTKVKELTGHTARILSLACSPDGSTVVSAAGDESLRFWNVFGSAPQTSRSVLPMGDLTFGMPTIR
ncbi:cell division cycle protein 20 [Nitzschia inconspicua]|uniref:Cell division cycle protein 20 n=1 Tax=Nitzschia inconspicua TaxID=303405 RepID=A0A9K3Q0G7_9STRA|nr:cell division cycle protein 20 [Nitzschia inconspicua]